MQISKVLCNKDHKMWEVHLTEDQNDSNNFFTTQDVNYFNDLQKKIVNVLFD